MNPGERRYINGVRAIEWSYGKSSKGNEQIVVIFGTPEGRKAWYGSFTEAAVDFTLEALEACGWDGRSLVKLDGMGSLDVDLCIEAEEYDGKVRDKIRFVNKPRAGTGEALEPSGVSALEARLRAKIEERAKARGEDFKDPFA